MEEGMERLNSLPDFIDDFLLLFDLIPQPGQLLLVGFPVGLHLLLQSLLQTPEPGSEQPRDTQQPPDLEENSQIHPGLCLPFPSGFTNPSACSSQLLIRFLPTLYKNFGSLATDFTPSLSYFPCSFTQEIPGTEINPKPLGNCLSTALLLKLLFKIKFQE